MGEYFHYVNHDKKMRFCIGDLGGPIKFSGIGRNLGARALGLLLTQINDRSNAFQGSWVGSWIGDRVECVGDHGPTYDLFVDYPEVTANIIVMLYQVDGAEPLIESANNGEEVFARIAHLIITQQFTDIQRDFEQAFGKQWQKKHKAICEKSAFIRLHNLV